MISVTAVLLSILLPALGKAKHQARTLIGASNQRQTAMSANLFANDRDGYYPGSVAYVAGLGGNWNGSDPRTMSAWITTPSHPHRAMSEYLRGYIEDADMMSCPKAPGEFKYLQEVWDAGDEWNNPDTTFDILAMRGAYCFYWNYTGLLDSGKFFKGPRNSSGGKGQSKLMMACYFGYDHRRTPGAYGSCEKLKGADVVEETLIESAWWSRPASGGSDLETNNVKLHAAYTDGHVESFTPTEAVPVKTIMNRATNQPYPSGVGPGDFYIPRDGVR